MLTHKETPSKLHFVNVSVLKCRKTELHKGNYGGGGNYNDFGIIVDNSSQFMDPWKGVVLVEEARAVPMVVVMDLVVEVVDMVAEGSKNSEEKGYSS